MHQSRKAGPIVDGLAEHGAAIAAGRGLFAAAAFFSVFVNLLMLTGPIFMLQVYDRVLSSRAEETLVALFGLVAFLYLMMGLLDHARARVMARAAARYAGALEARVFFATLRAPPGRMGAEDAPTALRDLDMVQRFIASPALLALFDMPWAPLFLGAIFVFHPVLGLVALGGGLVLVMLAALNQWRTRRRAAQAGTKAREAEHFADTLRAEGECVRSLGMAGNAHARWADLRTAAVTRGLRAADIAGGFMAATRALRLFLQSAMLATGAWLVLRGELTAGAMIAASILLGRALAPIELAIGQWELTARAWKGRAALRRFLQDVPPEPERTALPRPAARLQAKHVTIVPPGQSHAALRLVSFELEPGQALGVIGPSGAGKSSLARALTGSWPLAGGTIRLDGAGLEHYGDAALGCHVGYLPQRVTLFDGTVAQNIARLAPAPDPQTVVAAARAAAAHEMILRLPQGYDTPLSAEATHLSGGQIQRIGLARALYGDPVLLVLDEPNANLDNDGSAALNTAIRGVKAMGGAVIVMAHRPTAIRECDTLLALENGMRRAYGKRDDVLREVLANHAEVARAGVAAGVT